MLPVLVCVGKRVRGGIAVGPGVSTLAVLPVKGVFLVETSIVVPFILFLLVYYFYQISKPSIAKSP